MMPTDPQGRDTEFAPGLRLAQAGDNDAAIQDPPAVGAALTGCPLGKPEASRNGHRVLVCFCEGLSDTCPSVLAGVGVVSGQAGLVGICPMCNMARRKRMESSKGSNVHASSSFSKYDTALLGAVQKCRA